jgi:hypothetical protein
MIFKFKLSRAPLLNVVLSVLQVWDAAGSIPYNIEHARLAKKLATEPFQPLQPIPEFLSASAK